MQQLIQLDFSPVASAQFQLAQLIATQDTPNAVICHFTHWPQWSQCQQALEQWLIESGFKIQEVILGADRITWRVCLLQEDFYFHFEDLSESTWFESDCFDSDDFEIDPLQVDQLKAMNVKLSEKKVNALSVFSVWLLDYFNQKQV